MYLSELIQILDGYTNINIDVLINNIKTDTRFIEQGDIFIALKGNKYNGNDYIKQALEKGAIACISNINIDDKCIVVSDTYKALYKIANYIKNKYNIPLIAITGSNGKTTTKELLYHILNTKYKVLKNQLNENNLIGVSNTLFKLNNTYELIIMELGTNHIGEISELSNMCNPNLAVITNIGSSHIGNFKSKKCIFKEKYSITDGMNNIDLIVNGDDKYLKKICGFKCGLNKNNDLIAYNIKEYNDKIIFNIYLDKEYEVIFNNPGKHFINDILLVIKVCLNYHIDINTIISKINDFEIIDKRMKLEKINNNIIINDCYNSSYESIKCGIDYFKIINHDKVFILGDILELGKYSKKIHKKINRLLKYINNKKIYTIGNYSKHIKGLHFDSSEDFINYLKNNKINNSYIYIKGSRRMNLDIVYEYIKSNT